MSLLIRTSRRFLLLLFFFIRSFFPLFSFIQMALFGEKYGSTVRVVSIPGYSLELCGGTHARRVLECYPFKVLSESGIATGMRRVEAVAGQAAVGVLEGSHAALRRIAGELKATPETAAAALTKLAARAAELESQLSSARKAAFLSGADARAVVAEWQVDKQGAAVMAMVHEVPADLASGQFAKQHVCTRLPECQGS